MSGHLRHHHTAFGALESRDQADLSPWTAHAIPGYPKAVRMAELRLAVVPGELLGAKDIFTSRHGVLAHILRIIVGEYDQFAVDLNGVFVTTTIKHDPAAEAHHPGLDQHRVRP